MLRKSVLALVLAGCALAGMGQATMPSAGTTVTLDAAQKPGEKFPSEDALIWDFHNLGEVNGTTNLYRSASPLRDLEKKGGHKVATLAEAKVRLQRLYDHGIRTIVSLEAAPGAATQPGSGLGVDKEDKGGWVRLEQEAAEAVGIRWVSHPMANSGAGSLETMTDAQVMATVQGVADLLFKYSKEGGVDFHCSAGHDRTGIVTAYLRMKYEHWPVEKAIQEMRDYGHNWPKFSHNGGESSWHEEHLRGIEKMLEEGK